MLKSDWTAIFLQWNKSGYARKTQPSVFREGGTPGSQWMLEEKSCTHSPEQNMHVGMSLIWVVLSEARFYILVDYGRACVASAIILQCSIMSLLLATIVQAT